MRAPLNESIRSLYRQSVQRIIALLDGVFANLEDCLFEIAYVSEDEDIHRRCFNLMREMRVNHNAIRRGYARRLLQHLEDWNRNGRLYRFPEDTADLETLVHLAREASSRSRSHLAPAVTAIERLVAARIDEWHEQGGNRAVSGPVFPLSPETVTRVFLLSIQSIEIDDAQRDLVLGLFRRYVLDRLGMIIAAWSLELGLMDPQMHTTQMDKIEGNGVEPLPDLDVPAPSQQSDRPH